MKVSCLCPTYNRGGDLLWLLEEAVECFLRQTCKDAELVVCNDTPGQEIVCNHPRVRVLNVPTRFPSLSAKVQYMVENSTGEYLCRWDDDDIHLPNRLDYSLDQMGLMGLDEWRTTNHWFYPAATTLTESIGVGNSHVHSVWRRSVLSKFPGGTYPAGLSGCEDQAFNRYCVQFGVPCVEVRAPRDKIFYIYRWGTGSSHLSGVADYATNPTNPHQPHWDAIGKRPIQQGAFTLRPHWRENYVWKAAQAARQAGWPPRDPRTLANHFDYTAFYDWVAAVTPPAARLVEVGCLGGASLCHLANKCKQQQKGQRLLGVDCGVGVGGTLVPYVGTAGLLAGVREANCDDMVTFVAAESTQAAAWYPDNWFDFVFIDAGHDYQSVRADLQAWWPKVKPGGIIAGHDYVSAGWPEVTVAVDEFFGVPKYSLSAPQAAGVWVRKKVA